MVKNRDRVTLHLFFLIRKIYLTIASSTCRASTAMSNKWDREFILTIYVLNAVFDKFIQKILALFRVFFFTACGVSANT